MTIITRTNGQPFATESSARQQLTAKGLQDTHEVVSHEGGYALALKQVKTHTARNGVVVKEGDRVKIIGSSNSAWRDRDGVTGTVEWKARNAAIIYDGDYPDWSIRENTDIELVASPAVTKDDPITLQPGDHVSTKGMTVEQYQAVARAFMAAGAVDRGDAGFERAAWRTEFLGWDDRDNELWHATLRVGGFTGRHLTIDQVLGAANAKPENGEDSHCPQDIRTIANVNLHTKGDAQALRDAFDNLKSGSGGFPTITATQLDAVTDPITTLKQARQSRDEAEQAYQQALEEAREYLGDGFMLSD